MPDKRRLIIDIGTNSVLALLADYERGRLSVISDKRKTTKLGESIISTGRLSNTAIQRTVAAVVELIGSSERIFIALLGTEALRIAENASDFSEAIKQKTGYDLIILSGLKEAELSFLGMKYNLDKISHNITHIDVGGGSTEITNAVDGKIEYTISIPIGALKLRDMAHSDEIETYIGKADSIIKPHFHDIQQFTKSQVIATGGTITSVAAIVVGSDEYESSMIHGISLNAHQIHEVARRFYQTPPEYRPALIPFDPERADLILPGLGIFLSIMSIMGKDNLTVSTGGLRYGAALFPDKIST
jgi:exopolyphosphatase/guanosine-5'-triphosphate,3'-diphosphate pyrophosphatase